MNSQPFHSDRYALVRAALTAAIVCLCFSQNTLANIITRNVNVTLHATNIESFDLDVNLDGTNDFTFTAAFVPDPGFSVGFDVVDFPFASGNGVAIDFPVGNGFPAVSRLQVGNTVSGANAFSGPNDQGNLFFFTPFDLPSGNYEGQTGYLGLRFDTVNGTQYGFAEVTVNSLNALDNPLGLTIGTVGFNDIPDQPVQIAVVPEPAGPALFGIGALGFLMRARRKSAIKAKRGYPASPAACFRPRSCIQTTGIRARR